MLPKKIFRLSMCLNCEDIARQICAMMPRWRFFWHVFASCIFDEPRAARFKPASEIRTKLLSANFRCRSETKATPCMEMWQTSNQRWLRLDEEKERKKERKKEETTGQKYNVRICYAGRS